MKYSKMIKITGIILASIFISSKCQDLETNDILSDSYNNILDIKNIPKAPEDWNSFCFFDQGSWFGYALPEKSSESFFGGFPGPFLRSNSKWLSECLAKIIMIEDNKQLHLSDAKKSHINFSPGNLNQKFFLKNFIVKIQLCFSTNRTAIIDVTIKNISDIKRNIKISWTGNIFYDDASFSKDKNGIKINFQKNNLIGLLSIPSGEKFHQKISKNRKKYTISLDSEYVIEPKHSISTNLAQSFCFEEKELSAEIKKLASLNAKKIFNENENRWKKYFEKVIFVDTKWAKEKKYQNIAVKALETLVNNWKSSAKDLYHDGLIPSYAVKYFNGFWAWDSWKHAVAITRFDPKLAKDQVRTMYDYQDKFGMIADCIFRDSLYNNWRDTKPPLSAWAVWKIYESDSDLEFVKEMYDKLIIYHNWWYKYRDHDQNGLCEYGSTDGTLEAAMWESGWDDAVRFDGAEMVKNNKNAWSVNQESADLNAYLYAEKLYLASLSKAIGKTKNEQEFNNSATKLKSLIQTNMFDEETGFFYDIKLDDKSYIKVKDPGGWIPLWAKIASNEQAAKVKEVICDTSVFATYIPFPTVSKDNPKFMSGYWRGPVWLDQAYFGIKALENYGYIEEAEMFTKHLFERPEGLLKQGPIRENYNPINGKGMKVNHFSWSSAHLLLLYLENKD